ncbi:MAG: YraN family protein [Nevskia sp.]
MSLLRGAEAETRALRHLEARRLRLVARNWRCRGGELDLVMRDGETLVVVEVRSRGRSDYGSAFESIDARKQAKLILATQNFIAMHPEHAAREVRFDAVAIDGEQLQWLKAAFDAG